MQYALLIYTPEPTEDVPQEQIAAEMEGYNVFSQHLRDRNAMLGGEALDSTATATTVRDEGDARRLLPRRGSRSRRGHRLCGDDPGRPARLHRGPTGLGLRRRQWGRGAGHGRGRELKPEATEPPNAS